MANTINMPKLGLTMTEGVVLWKKQIGDLIHVGDIVFEVETDKLTNAVESEFEGVLLKQMCEEGGEISCKKPVAVIGQPDEALIETAVESLEIRASSPELEAAHQVVAPTPHEHLIASPIAKKIAKDNGFSLSEVTGTGPNGRIVLKDVTAYLSADNVKISPTAAKMAEEFGVDVKSISKLNDGRIMKSDIQSITASSAAPIVTAEKKTIKLSGMRKTISKRMSESWSTSPRVCYNSSVDTSAMTELKNKLTPIFNESGIKLTFNHILTMVCAKVLVEMPEINGSLTEDVLTLHTHVNIGMAVGMDNGLIVPNVKNCEEKSLMEIAIDTENSIDKARNNKLTPDEMTGGTFTITNLGMFGIESFSPIINQPELAILGVNAIIQTPVVINGEIVIRPMMTLSLVADHRVIDGLKAAQCLKRIKSYLENPYMLLI